MIKRLDKVSSWNITELIDLLFCEQGAITNDRREISSIYGKNRHPKSTIAELSGQTKRLPF
jgi:hypothetical protein